MIFFCEDCGEKNSLTPAHLKTGKAVFRCTACSYMNSYAISKETDAFSKTDVPFPPPDSSPEIIGSFLFHKKKGVLRNHMPAVLKEKDLAVLGNILAKNLFVCRTEFPDVNEAALILSGRNMIARMIDENLTFIIAARTFPLPETGMDQPARLMADIPDTLVLKDNQNAVPK